MKLALLAFIALALAGCTSFDRCVLKEQFGGRCEIGNERIF
jgi:hypothetical protein